LVLGLIKDTPFDFQSRPDHLIDKNPKSNLRVFLWVSANHEA